MSENAIILGAGFSHAAGIPLLAGFVDQMWDFAVRASYKGMPIASSDRQIFAEAIEVKDELDSYHGRAVFDDRNIEDVLSILSFNALGGTAADKNKLDKINRAIVKTIELTCAVTHPGVSADGRDSAIKTGPEMYRRFWQAILNSQDSNGLLPTIITFNYDLVLERSLFQQLIGTNYDRHSKQVPFKSFQIDYDHRWIPEIAYKVKYLTYSGHRRSGPTHSEGTAIEPLEDGKTAEKSIDILKLHGSINFPREKNKIDPASYNVVECQDRPDILPPISNKLSIGSTSKMWAKAIHTLREVKNIAIVGYSLPKTDIYMQYFLKAALGPNRNLNIISVFDPALSDSNEMRDRYKDCFSTQLHNRIRFNKANAERFTEELFNNPTKIFFLPNV